MEFRRTWLIGVAACVAAHAFAQESAPVQPATPAAPVAATPAPPPPGATQTTNTSAASATDAKPDATATSASPLEGELDAEKIMAAQRAGYKIKNENGQTMLCRRELQTGSRVRYNTSCLTPRQWAQLEEETKLQLKTMERKPMNTGSR
jgi:hypothetical protein